VAFRVLIKAFRRMGKASSSRHHLLCKLVKSLYFNFHESKLKGKVIVQKQNMLYGICYMLTNGINNGSNFIRNDISDLSNKKRLGMDVILLA